MSIEVRKKLKSREGASLMAALLLFLICATVGSVILAAAASSMGRTSSPDTDANRQRYSLESASRVIINDILGDTAAADYQGLTVGINQTWYVHLSSADYATKQQNKATTLDSSYVSTESDLTSAVLYDSDSYIKNPPTQVSYGDFVMMVDQDAATGKDKYPTYSQLSESGSAADETYAWDLGADNAAANVSWTKTINGKTYAAYRNTLLTSTDQSLQDTLCLMEDEVFRHYWYAINNTTQEKVQSIQKTTYTVSTPLTQQLDPLKSAPSGNWTLITGRMDSTYSVGTDEKNPIEIDPPAAVDGIDTKMYPVYAQVSLDRDGVLTIHLYCGSDDGTTDTTRSVMQDPKSASSSLYLVFEPEGDGPTLKYTTTSNNLTTDTHDSIYVQTSAGITQAAGSTDDLRNLYDRQDVILHITKDQQPDTESDTAGSDGDSSGLHQYTYDVYTKVTPKQTLTSEKRSWDYSVTWKNVSISTTAPSAE